MKKAFNPSAPRKELLLAEYGKFYTNRPNMAEDCVRRVAANAVLFSGEIITVEKRPVETSFCFGESGYDYDDALRRAQTARTSEDYFRHQNMARFKLWIGMLENALNDSTWFGIREEFYSQPENCALRSINQLQLWEIIEACGGSVNQRDLPGKTVVIRGTPYRIATKAELRVILDAYRYAAEAHEKKVNAYLKRYGLSKVQAWTYWRDA